MKIWVQKCLGVKNQIFTFYRFFINDVVKLVNCNVQDKPDTEQEKKFNPVTSVPFRISVCYLLILAFDLVSMFLQLNEYLSAVQTAHT